MRLWSLHPRYLDAKGLVAAWREGLLAQAVLEGRAQGYRHHPQLLRFREADDPLGHLSFFLMQLWLEAERRGYSFDRSRIDGDLAATPSPIPVGDGQVRYEFELLKSKLERRAVRARDLLCAVGEIEVNPAFIVIPGSLADWERPIPALLEIIPNV